MAAKELAHVRTKFVEKVSKDMITQLLDDLLDDQVFNDGEKDSILEENVKTTDKARALLDRVKRKGDEASRKMIAHLKERDPTLHSELGLSCSQPPQPPQPAAQVKMEKEWSTTLVHSTDAFWNKKRNDPHVYPVDKKSIGNRVALLITNIKFTHLSYRHGAEQDEKNMKKLLSDLRYEVVKYRNLTAQEIDDALIQFSRHPKLRETDSVVVVIMSHGKMRRILGVNYKKKMSADVFPINNIYEHLGSKKCPALLNKPKIVIIQACRGAHNGAVLVSDCASQVLVCDDVSQPDDEDDMEEDAGQIVHKEKDFTSLLSSTPGTVSYRDPVSGSVLIQVIVDVFYTFTSKDHIEELFRKVMQHFEESMHGSVRQMPTKERCTLTKAFYFFPGH